MPARLGVLASHGGTNLQALCDRAVLPGSAFEVSLVISNNSASGALERARRMGIPAIHLSGKTHTTPEALDNAILSALRDAGAQLVVAAGYMKKIGPQTIAAYPGRILNIHPALLPRHGGQGMYGQTVHEAVLAAGDRMTGVSIHLVTDEYDRGPLVAQQEVPVLDGDTVETLAARVLAVEHQLLPDTVQELAVQLVANPS
jgi:phosphoribosylglycinamide formyltransferase 1